jgi:hypothetical protein
MAGSTAATRLHTVCVLRLYGHTAKAIGGMIGIDPQSVSRILNTPRGRSMMLDMQDKQVELAIDPIQQKLAEYADFAADKLFELIDADAENVQRQAAKDILEMAGYTPKRTIQDTKEADTTIIVGQMNIGQGANADAIRSSILENSASEAHFTLEELEDGEQHNGTAHEVEEQVGDEQIQAKRLQSHEHDPYRGCEGSEDGERVQQRDIANEERLGSKPGQRWLSGQSGNSADDG